MDAKACPQFSPPRPTDLISPSKRFGRKPAAEELKKHQMPFVRLDGSMSHDARVSAQQSFAGHGHIQARKPSKQVVGQSACTPRMELLSKKIFCCGREGGRGAGEPMRTVRSLDLLKALTSRTELQET